MKNRLFYAAAVLLLLSAIPGRIYAQCLTGWNYKTPITISNGTSTTLSAYQVKITLNTASLISAGKMNLNGNDIRFTDNSCNLLPYFIESGINTSNTVVWVKIPSISGSGSTLINLYYGNTTASATSNADSVFLFYDSFDSQDTSKWFYPTNFGYNYRYTGGNLEFSGDANSRVSPYTKRTFPSDVVIETTLNKNENCADHFIYLSQSTTATFNWSFASNIIRFAYNCDRKEIYSNVASSTSSASCASISTYDVKMSVSSSSGLSFSDNRCSTISHTGSMSNFHLFIGADQDNSSYWSSFAYLRIRRFASSEPSVSLGSEVQNDHFVTSAVSSSFYCVGSSLNVSFTSKVSFNSGNIFTVQLSNSSGNFSSATNIGSLAASSPGTISATIPTSTPAGTNYRIRVISSSPTYTSSDNGSDITIIALPAANTGGDRTICEGSSISLGTVATGGNRYKWQPATGLSSDTVSNPLVTPFTTTVYTLTETSPAGCINTGTAKITVNPAPNVLTGGNKTICIGSSTRIGAAPVSNYSYAWSPVAGLSSPFSSDPLAKPTTTTIYRLTVTDNFNGCSKTDSITVTVRPTPEASTGKSQAICEGSVTQIGDEPVSGNLYSWSPSTGLSSSNLANPFASPTTTTTYKLTEINPVLGCSKTDSVTITVIPGPEPQLNGLSSICANTITNYSTNRETGTTFTWSVTGGTILSGQGTSAIDVNWGSSQIASVKIVQRNLNGCKDSIIQNIKINPLPDARWNAIPQGQGTGRFRFIPYDTTNATYIWDFGDGNSANDARPVHSFSFSSNYRVNLTVITSNGCRTTKDSILNVNITTSGIEELPAEALDLNIFPNPSQDMINISFNLPERSPVKVQIYDLTGKEVGVIKESVLEEGKNDFSFKLSDFGLNGGMYLVRMQIGNNIITKKITQIK